MFWRATALVLAVTVVVLLGFAQAGLTSGHN